jgi:general secretion pathway protein E
MTKPSIDDFITRLLAHDHLRSDAAGALRSAAERSADSPLRKIWDALDISAKVFADEVAQFYALERIQLPQLVAAKALTERFSPRFLREAAVFPFESSAGQIILAVADPEDSAAARAAEIIFGGPVRIAVASFEDIATVLTERLGGDEETSAAGAETSAITDDDIESLRDLASGAPVVHAVNDLIERAIELRASDIHVEPYRNSLTIRMRVDGLLRPTPAPVDTLPQALISRIKILAGLNIAERRLPQDGAARMKLSRAEIDVRVATVPTTHGESAVIRLLPRDNALLQVKKLGLSTSDETTVNRLLALPHGLVIVTGPTGSGKTTTLATLLTMLNEPRRKILTIEDPIEYEIQGLAQSQVKPSIGFTFASAMRAFLRQDPDVIMVGEVRDSETAGIAVNAALTGHLVLTTLHTETAAAAVPRLLDLGVESFLLKSTLRAVIAQRLVRLLCDHCKRKRPLSAADMTNDPRYGVIGLRVDDEIFEPVGCEHCGGVGYRGRIGLFELLELTDGVRDFVGPGVDAHRLDMAARASGMTTMIDDAVAKCRAGRTSAAEVLRVATVR